MSTFRRTDSFNQAGAIYALGMSQPESLDEMVKVGNNMCQPTGTVKPLALAERNVRQGYLEMSGANPVRQMMAMIETTRAFEANTRMIQSQDSMTGHADQPGAAGVRVRVQGSGVQVESSN